MLVASTRAYSSCVKLEPRVLGHGHVVLVCGGRPRCTSCVPRVWPSVHPVALCTCYKYGQGHVFDYLLYFD